MASSRNPLRTAATAGVLSFAALAGMSGLAHVATAATSSAHPDVTFIKECAGEQSQKPATYTLACADANQSLEKLRWSKWGAGVATATGMMRMNDCVPTCAGGKDRTVKVSVRADKLQQREASQTYGRLRVTVIGKAPKGFAKTGVHDLGQGPDRALIRAGRGRARPRGPSRGYPPRPYGSRSSSTSAARPPSSPGRRRAWGASWRADSPTPDAPWCWVPAARTA